jgi:hypothetical protein
VDDIRKEVERERGGRGRGGGIEKKGEESRGAEGSSI